MGNERVFLGIKYKNLGKLTEIEKLPKRMKNC
jgi:hypothetical protein